MEFEIIKDQNGKEHIGFNKEGFNDDNLMGDKSSDFEILQILGKGSQGNVYKVCSLINHKIYAMKIIDLDFPKEMNENERKEKESEIKYAYNGIELLKKLNHPNVVKYYKHFKENNKIYIIMEYFDNGDLNTYIKVLKYIKNNGQTIKHDELWNIFYQCMSGLLYLHSSNIAHRDIKPSNIFMSKNKMVKIGDFGVSALIKEKTELEKFKTMKNSFVGTKEYLAPEIYLKNYNEKVDIFSMGCVFYELYFLTTYRKEDYQRDGNKFKQVFVDKKMPSKLDDDFMKIIFKMLNNDPNQRPDSKTIFEDIKEHYNKIFIQNSGFYSVLRCLINLPYFNKLFIKKSKENNNFKNKIYSKNYLFCYENKKNWIESLTFFRHKIIEENNFMDNNKEINPDIIVSFILEKMHGELNKVESTKLDFSYNPYNEENVKQQYLKYFLLNFNSIISSDFIGHLESFRKCKNCNTIAYLFTYFYTISFDLNFPSLINAKKTERKLIELFQAQNIVFREVKNMCNTCKNRQIYMEKKMFYCLPFQLIIYLDRGNNNANKIKIIYPEKLDLSPVVRGKNSSPTNFFLTGIIKRNDINGKEHYISLIWDYSKTKKWFLYDNEKVEELKSQEEHKSGTVVMLFYTSPR